MPKPVKCCEHLTGRKTKQARFPVSVTFDLAEEGGFRIALRALHLVG